MKKGMRISVVLIAFASFTMVSCKKEEIPVTKPYNIEYKIWGTPLSNTSVSGTVTYISKASATTEILSALIKLLHKFRSNKVLLLFKASPILTVA